MGDPSERMQKSVIFDYGVFVQQPFPHLIPLHRDMMKFNFDCEFIFQANSWITASWRIVYQSVVLDRQCNVYNHYANNITYSA